MAKRLKIGDVVEIATKKGLAYAQYTHKHPSFGALLRVLRPLFRERPVRFEDVVSAKVRFSVFFPLKAAVEQGILTVAGHAEVPNDAQRFPLFRNGIEDPETGRVASWWLWDGAKEWEIGQLNAEQRDYPILEVWNDALLIQRIESDWRVSQES